MFFLDERTEHDLQPGHSSANDDRMELRSTPRDGSWDARGEHPAPADPPMPMKEVVAILRPERWTQTKARLQQLCVPAFTQQRVLGRGRARGLQYLPRQGATRHTGIQYLPKRMVSWIVEDVQVEPLIQAIMEVNRTGHIGDGKIFVLPVDEAVRIRTGDRGSEALRSAQPHESAVGHAHVIEDSEPAHASRE